MTQRELDRLSALLRAEELWRGNHAVVAGIDEVGRGPLAGPVTVACVVMPQEPLVEYVNDSKHVTQRRRGIAAGNIRKTALRYEIVSIGPERIDEINILNATKEAMRQAACAVMPDTLLVDAVDLGKMPFACVPIIGGDGKCYSIAAASILAKVTRDEYMRKMDEIYPQYGFARNKGYGTAEHIAALRQYGPCPIHRRSFLKNILREA